MAFSLHVREGSVTRQIRWDQEILALPFEGCLLLAVLFLFAIFIFSSFHPTVHI